MNPYLVPGQVRAALRTLHLSPSRGMGQHFLIDAQVLERIVATANLTSNDIVVEVGPGLGVLTWELVRRAGRVIAVELDKRLAARLRDEFGAGAGKQEMASLDIRQANVLDLPPASILHQATDETPRGNLSYKVVANLPYAITSPVLRHFLEQEPKPQIMVVLVQWEVAQRITAQPGNLSLLAHAIQMYAEPAIVGRVASSSFLPEPAVDTAIVHLQTRAEPAVAVDNITTLFRIIKAGFLHPRKKLSNGLPGGLAAMGHALPREQTVAALHQASVSPDRRAETLTLEEWAGVYCALQEHLA